MKIDGINHCALRVQNLDRAEAFYGGVLKLRRVGERNGMRFYSSGRHHHELALVEDPGFSGPGRGLEHIGLNMADEDAFRQLYEHLLALGWPVSDIIDHTISHGFYLRDPDGYLLEIVTDRPQREWRDDPQAFRQDRLKHP